MEVGENSKQYQNKEAKINPVSVIIINPNGQTNQVKTNQKVGICC